MSSEATAFGACPVPIASARQILLGHGSGGKLTSDLVEKIILPAFHNETLGRLDDAAVLPLNGARLAFTTDSYVVTPIFFPGGDIGQLAVNGTVNDLAVAGAKPLFLSLAFILEEGFELDEFERVVASVRDAARRAQVQVVTGDTKVVGRGSGDKVFINTAGIGVVREGVDLASARVAPGDAILVSGTMGDHGVAILSQRHGMTFDEPIVSDTAPLHELVEAILDAFPDVHAMRDPTRGGLASSLVEIASRQKVGMRIDERAVPIRESVRGACEILGLDPVFAANEGKLVAFVPEEAAEGVLAAMRGHPLGRDAARIGTVVADARGMVRVRTSIAGERILDLPFGELLPRIC